MHTLKITESIIMFQWIPCTLELKLHFNPLWEGVWDSVQNWGLISWLVLNVAVACGVSAVMYWLAVSELDGLVAPKPPAQVVGMETCISCSCSYCVSGITLIPRPSRACDLVTMVEVGSARLTSLERVTTGAGSVSRGARAKPNSLGRSLQPPSLAV